MSDSTPEEKLPPPAIAGAEAVAGALHEVETKQALSGGIPPRETPEGFLDPAQPGPIKPYDHQICQIQCEGTK